MNLNTFAASGLNATVCAALIAAASVASLALCADAAAAPPSATGKPTARPQPQMKITYLIFSGRPNPTVTVPRGRDFDMVTRKLDEAARTGTRVAGPADPPVLGYNGILIEYPDATGEVARVVLKKNGLRSESAGVAQAATRSVSALQLEESLLTLGRDRGVLDARMIDAIRADGR